MWSKFSSLRNYNTRTMAGTWPRKTDLQIRSPTRYPLLTLPRPYNRKIQKLHVTDVTDYIHDIS